MVTILAEMAEAMECASCPGREGPFGGYDYGHNEAFYGPAPEQGRYVIRDFRDPSSDGWGKRLHYSHDREQHERMFEKMTREHIAAAGLKVALDHIERHLSAVQYDPAPYTSLKHRLAALRPDPTQ